jgi:hypothetical protein
MCVIFGMSWYVVDTLPFFVEQRALITAAVAAPTETVTAGAATAATAAAGAASAVAAAAT